MKIERTPGPDWLPLPRHGARGVQVKVHLITNRVFVAQLRFTRNATIDEHPGERSTDVVCLSGSGYVSLGSDTSAFQAGDRVFWPAGVPHRLWTGDTPMDTLMVERLDPS